MMEPRSNRTSLSHLPALGRVSALALFAGAPLLAHAARAQQADPVQPSAPAATQLVADLKQPPMDLATLAGLSYSAESSSVSAPVDPDSVDHLTIPGTSAEMQPPPRRRYGRPRYNDSAHNADGSPKYTFVAAAGFTAPLGNTYHYLNTQWGIQVGGGRNFNKNFGVLAQFDYDKFGFNGRTLFNQLSLYNYGLSPSNPDYLGSLDGNTHIWSFTLNPVYTISAQGPVGAYVVLGGGFYHKVANFTTPEAGYVDYGFAIEQVTQNAVIDHYTSNAFGGNGGFGITYKASRFSGERLFAEARYVVILDSQRTGLTAANVTSNYGQNYAGTDFYPANSNRTTYTVYKAGIRF
jgi:hypothetical protein